MKNLILVFASTLAFGFGNLSFAQTVLLTEDFETDGLGSRYTSANVFPSGIGCSDYFIRTQNGGAQCITNTINNVSGTFFWAGEDTDDGGNPSPPLGTLTLNPVSVAGYSTLEVKALLAIGRATGDRFEPDDELLFQYNIDGGGWNTCGAFYGIAAPINSDLSQDTDLDGIGDGAALTQTLTEFIFSVPATGTNMQVRFIMGNNGGTEEVIVDNIRIEGTIAALPEIDIEGNTTSIADGDVTPSLSDDTDFGSVAIGATATNTFTIQNEGAGDLTLSGGPNFVSISGSSLFTVTAQPSSPIAAAGSSTFNVQFDAACPNTAGTYTATVSVSSDDADESPYTFDVTATITGVDTDSDGALDACDSDDDNDGVADGSDPDDTDFNVCGDSDADGCDDCSVTNDGFGALSDSDPANDGTDSDCDGICDATDATDGASQTRGNMLTFNGSADYVSLGDIAELNFGKADDFTVEAWINSSSISTAMQIVSKYDGDLLGGIGWGFQISGSSPAFYMTGGTGVFDLMVSVPTGAPNVKDGLWHHVAVVYDGSNNVTGCTFYIDGVAYAGIDGGGFVASVVGTVTNTESATIGAYDGAVSGVGEYWEGSLDEVRVWDDQRTQTEIRENLHLSLSGGCDASLDGYWKFNETAGTTASDLSGNSNDGTHAGAPSLVASQCAVGSGVSTTHSMTANATTYSSPSVTAGYPMDLSFTSVNPGGEVVVTCIFGNPVGGVPATGDGSFHYWVVNNYGPNQAGLDGAMTFNYETGHVSDATLSEYSLYKRGSRETGAWTETNTAANTVNMVPDFLEFSGVASFSMFWEVSKNSNSTLPVELVVFDASVINNNDVLLDWATASEVDNKGFTIQRSTDNVSWTEIGFVEGQGTKITTTEYSFIDENAGAGVVYYRLIQLDFNGELEYSGVRTVFLGQGIGDVSLYPNPSTGSFTLTLAASQDVTGATIEIIDPIGRIVERRPLNGNTDVFDLKDPQAGLYIVRVITENDQKMIRMVVQ